MGESWFDRVRNAAESATTRAPRPGDTREKVQPSGRIVSQTYVGVTYNSLGDEIPPHWESDSSYFAPQYGDGGGYPGPTPEELAIDWAQVNAITRGQDLDLQSAMRGYDIQEELGEKGIAVDWANIGIDRQRMGIERERTLIEKQQAAEDARSNLEREAENRRQRALDAASRAVDAYLRGSQLSDARRLASFQESRSLLPSLVDPNQQYFAGQEPGGTLATMAQRYGLPFTGTEIQHRQMRPGELALPPTEQQIGSDIVGQVEALRGMGQ